MKRALIASTLFALASIIGYGLAASSPRGEDGEPALVLFSSPRQDFDKLTYKSPSFRAEVELKRDAIGEYLWARTWRDPNPASGQDTIEAAAFKVDAVLARALLSRTLPLTTPRAVERDRLASGKLAELGLDRTDRTLSLVQKESREVTFELGREGYGHRRVYALDRERVVLLDEEVVRALERADTYLPQRTLWEGGEKQIVSARITDGTTEVEIIQHNRDDLELAYWSFSDREGRSKRARALIKMLEVVRATGYAADQTPDRSSPDRITLRFEDGREDTLTFDFASNETNNREAVGAEAKKEAREMTVSSPWLRGRVELNPIVGERLHQRFVQALRARDEEVMLSPPTRTEHVH